MSRRPLNEPARGRRVIYNVIALLIALFAGTFLLGYLDKARAMVLTLAAVVALAVFIRIVKLIRRHAS